MTALTIFQQGQVPAHIAEAAKGLGENIQDRQTVPSLSPGGKTWTISADGKKTKLQRRNADGDLEPLGIMKVVILDFAQDRGRAYYEGEYNADNVSPPLCWSENGIAPDASVPAKVSDKLPVKPSRCADCPMSVKGSKITPQGKSVTACGQHRMLAVVPEFAQDMTPLRFKIAMTSDWDKQNPEAAAEGWLAFMNYVESLKAGGCAHTALVVTKMKFDPNADYPKVFFSADRWLHPEEVAKLAPIAKGDAVKKLLTGFTPDGADGVAREPQPEPEAAAKQPDPTPEPDEDDGGVVVMTDDEEGVIIEATATEVKEEPAELSEIEKLKAALAAAEAKAHQKPAQEEVAVVVEEPTIKEPKKAAKKAAAAVEQTSTDVPGDVQSLLDNWVPAE